MSASPKLFGIVNITTDSFSDGGCYLDPQAALRHGKKLLADGADVLDIGPASSHPDACDVSPETEIARLEAVWPHFKKLGAPLSVDSFQPETQHWALANGTDWLNDTNGFCDPTLYAELAASDCRLVVMHSVQAKGIATRDASLEGDIWTHILRFFEARLAALEAAGIARTRMVLDPGMGFFLGNQPENSIAVLADLERLKRQFGLPVLVCVSRKSFLQVLADVKASDSLPATLAAELHAVGQGIDYIRTHEPAPLKQALVVNRAFGVRE